MELAELTKDAKLLKLKNNPLLMGPLIKISEPEQKCSGFFCGSIIFGVGDAHASFIGIKK